MQQIFIITGPTASGKSKLAIDLAKKNNAQIINADSLQVYKELPILSACPENDNCNFATQRLIIANNPHNYGDQIQPIFSSEGIVHHLFQCLTVQDSFSVAHWLQKVKNIIDNGENFVIVGGTAMYIRNLVDGLSAVPEICKENLEIAYKKLEMIGNAEFYKKLCQIDPYFSKFNQNDTQRMIRSYSVFLETGKNLSFFWKLNKKSILPQTAQVHKMKILPNREMLYNNCNVRFTTMIKNGVLEEVQNITKIQGLPYSAMNKTIGLTELINYLQGNITLDKAIETAQQHTRNYAKRQYTWFNNKFFDFETVYW